MIIYEILELDFLETTRYGIHTSPKTGFDMKRIQELLISDHLYFLSFLPNLRIFNHWILFIFTIRRMRRLIVIVMHTVEGIEERYILLLNYSQYFKKYSNHTSNNIYPLLLLDPVFSCWIRIFLFLEGRMQIRYFGWLVQDQGLRALQLRKKNFFWSSNEKKIKKNVAN